MNALIGKNLEQLSELAVTLGLRRFAGAQLADWIYKKRARSIDDLTNLSKSAREQLDQKYTLGLLTPVEVQTSTDGTRKYLFQTEKGNSFEAVYIPSETSRTLCISSQTGCRMGCHFCATAQLGFTQHLSAHQIVAQILSVEETAQLTNVVFMGMGEPMDNIANVLGAIEILTAPWGLAWSPTRITVSTVGVLKGLERLLRETKVSVAISLHNPFADERIELMPAEKANPIATVIERLRAEKFTHHRRLSFEYIVFEGVNDTERHASGVAKLLNGLGEVRVNLIRFHTIPQSLLRGASDERVKWFNGLLNAKRVLTTTRSSRGEDIFAACGLLAGSKR